MRGGERRREERGTQSRSPEHVSSSVWCSKWQLVYWVWVWLWSLFTKGRRIYTQRIISISISPTCMPNVLCSTEPAISRLKIKTKVWFHGILDWHSWQNVPHVWTTFIKSFVCQIWNFISGGCRLYLERTWWSNRRWRGRPEGKPLTRIFWLRHPDTLAIPWPMAVFWFMTYTGPSSSTSLSSSSCQCCHTIAVPLYFIVIYTVLQWHLFEILLQLSPAAAEWWYGMVRHKQNKTFPARR